MLGLQEACCEAVFISDLHLNAHEEQINARFRAFIKWAVSHTKSVYILGDFFHAWAGDDAGDLWSDSIARDLKWLSLQGISIYYMHGNRDFLLGRAFARAAGMTILPEPSVIQFEKESILLAHGDAYCTQDKAHQRFRRFTRHPWFAPIFLSIPLRFRQKLVQKVRQHSQTNTKKSKAQMDVVIQFMLSQMDKQAVKCLIHGHTHKPGLSNHPYNNKIYSQFVLSDWDDSPHLLCYHKTKGFSFVHNVLLEE